MLLKSPIAGAFFAGDLLYLWCMPAEKRGLMLAGTELPVSFLSVLFET
jgi:hypothetical protein